MARFDDAYRNGSPPWVIGEPQPTIVTLERAGWIRGRVLDVGSGTGEHTIMLARLGYNVVGIDGAPAAVAAARANAEAQGIDARFEVADAMALAGGPTYGTILDSALFHIFDAVDRAVYLASLHAATEPDGLLHILALSDTGRGFGPEVGEGDLRAALGPGSGWELDALDATTYRGVVGEAHSATLGLAVGTVVDEPAWLARAHRC